MSVQLADRILAAVHDAEQLYHRLIVVVGPPRTGKTETLRALAQSKSWPVLNVNLRLSERLIDLSKKQRALNAAAILGEILDAETSPVVLLDNIESIFSPELQQDPLRLLQGLSRNRTVVVSWCGEFDGESMFYAEPGHPEFRRYRTPDAVLIWTIQQDSFPTLSGGSPTSATEQAPRAGARA